MAALTITRGTNAKPAATDALADVLQGMGTLRGELFVGYPIIGTPDGRQPIDALLISPDMGLVVFDLVEGASLGSYEARQDDAATALESRLLNHRELVSRRRLRIPIRTVTFAPAVGIRGQTPSTDDYHLANAASLMSVFERLQWDEPEVDLYEHALSALQSISTIRRSRQPRDITDAESRGARLQRLEGAIATLDALQSRAVIETVDGVQRLRGLAGSGKTIVLALKAAYLHAQHPEWRIAVTFNTRSLKDHFTRLITSFTIEQTGDEPDWSKLRVLSAWGAAGGSARSGIYFEFCQANGVEWLDFIGASRTFGREEAFASACQRALDAVSTPTPMYDVLLVDEAQDLPPSFLRLCYHSLGDDKRLVYAYDELQNLSGPGLPPAAELFGSDAQGKPLVSFDQDYGGRAQRDIILEKCYRNSRPVLATAHAIGFGVNRRPPAPGRTGLVQMFDEPVLWRDIGYEVKEGALEAGRLVSLARTPATSPMFLEDHSSVDDLVHFRSFRNSQAQAEWVARQIQRNVTEEDLRHDDIVIINPNPLTTRKNAGILREALLDVGVVSHIAGVETSADTFFRQDEDSITMTGIFRAKGNEAGMVYIVNAHESQENASNLAGVRNRLFTAITRSKAWVRVLGVGSAMDALIAEYEAVRDADFELRFQYPSASQLAQIQVVHRDMTAAERKVIDQRRHLLRGLLNDLQAGKLFPEDLDPDVLADLSAILNKQQRAGD